jgi:hypothetical protein
VTRAYIPALSKALSASDLEGACERAQKEHCRYFLQLRTVPVQSVNQKLADCPVIHIDDRIDAKLYQ